MSLSLRQFEKDVYCLSDQAEGYHGVIVLSALRIIGYIHIKKNIFVRHLYIDCYWIPLDFLEIGLHVIIVLAVDKKYRIYNPRNI